MIVQEENYLAHYGILRRSGRYPWGSGADTISRSKSFQDHVSVLSKNGMTEAEIARGFGMTTTELRAAKSIAKNEIRQADIAFAVRLKDKGYSNTEIGRRMNLNESSVRGLLSASEKDKKDILMATADMLKKQVDEKGMIDIGSGVENHIGITSTKLNSAVAVLKDQGYTVHSVKVNQIDTGLPTTFKVLARPGTTQKDVFVNRLDIRSINEHSEDGGRSYLGVKPPISISSKRIAVRYAEDGGTDSDGVIYIRPGVKDLSMGSAKYAQVRIAVDDSHYLKGMAVYNDKLPDGVDIMFNTNKSNTGNKLDAMKKIKDDPENPFGAIVRQRLDPVTGEVTSALNIVGKKEGAGEEGSWDTWSRNLPSQFLSKQNPKLAQEQLDKTYRKRKEEYDEINSLTNPVVKKKLLESFADDTDSAAVHLKAAALPRQATQVLLPDPTLKPTEVYAPNFRNGERVALVRFPHGGTFEIPELTVNNNHPNAKKNLGMVKDAIAINPKVAERLSGADFDGDFVLVIPNNSGRVKSTPALEGLKDFDPKRSYPKYEGMRAMDSRMTGIQMGLVSNLITDMTIQGASADELARAVRHSMVVIDAEKHELNYQQSAKDNGISQLMKKYQGRSTGGASTLISRASGRIQVEERKARSAAAGGYIDKETGKKMYEPTGATYRNKNGEIVKKTFTSKKLAETDNAHTLSSGTPMEKIYADHSNRLKDLANEARKSSVHTEPIKYSPSAKAAYANEVASLNSKLNLALQNRPLERQAQLVANATFAAKKRANPDMSSADAKRIKAQAMAEARLRTGAKNLDIMITEREWEAIQAGAISSNKLSQILDKSDLDNVKKLATPRAKLLMTDAKRDRAQAMLASGYTQAQVADALGVSLTTLKDSFE